MADSLFPLTQVEKLARTLFLWKVEVHNQKEKVYEMRRWNEALVANMLPEHVARHFLGSKKRDEVRVCLGRSYRWAGINFPPALPLSTRGSAAGKASVFCLLCMIP